MVYTVEIDPGSIESINNVKTENDEDWYHICWKDSWIPRSQLNKCQSLIERYLRNLRHVDLNSQNENKLPERSISRTFSTESQQYDENLLPEVKRNSQDVPINKLVDIKIDVTLQRQNSAYVGQHEVSASSYPPVPEEKSTITEVKDDDIPALLNSCRLNPIEEQFDIMPCSSGNRKEETPTVKKKDSTVNRTDAIGIDQVVEIENLNLEENINPPKLRLKTLDRPSWCLSDDVKTLLAEFNATCAKQPVKQIKAARPQHEIYMKTLEKDLKASELCKKLEYTGSMYEKLKITEDTLEFDVMFLIDGEDIELLNVEDRPGYSYLHVKDGRDLSRYAKFIDSSNELVPDKMVVFFKNKVLEIISNMKESDNLKVGMNGAAVRLQVFKENKDLWFEVDLVPAFEIKLEGSGKKVLYVAKPFKEYSNGAEAKKSWRRSFSTEEKLKLEAIDKNNGCRREVLRMVKALCKREPTLEKLTSFHLKTTLFHVVEQQMLEGEWNVGTITERVFDFLGFLEQFLEHGILSHYHIREMNILQDIKNDTINNIRCRIKTLRSSEKKFKKAIEVK